MDYSKFASATAAAADKQFKEDIMAAIAALTAKVDELQKALAQPAKVKTKE